MNNVEIEVRRVCSTADSWEYELFLLDHFAREWKESTAPKSQSRYSRAYERIQILLEVLNTSHRHITALTNENSEIISPAVSMECILVLKRIEDIVNSNWNKYNMS